MPWRMSPDRTKITFMTFVQMPALIYRARQTGGQCSNTRYIQEAVCEKLARDGIEPLPSLLAKLPRDAAQYHDTLRETGVA